MATSAQLSHHAGFVFIFLAFGTPATVFSHSTTACCFSAGRTHILRPPCGLPTTGLIERPKARPQSLPGLFYHRCSRKPLPFLSLPSTTLPPKAPYQHPFQASRTKGTHPLEPLGVRTEHLLSAHPFRSPLAMIGWLTAVSSLLLQKKWRMFGRVGH